MTLWVQWENTPLHKHLIPVCIARLWTCAHILKSAWAVRPLLILWGRYYEFVYFCSGRELTGLLSQLCLGPGTFLTYWLREGRRWTRGLLRCLLALTFYKVVTFFHVLERFSLLTFLSVPLPPSTTDFCLLTIWSNISMSTTDCLAHGYHRTKEKLPYGWP